MLFKVSCWAFGSLVSVLNDLPNLNFLFLFLESFESAKAISTGPTSRGLSKVGKSSSNGVLKHGSKAVSSV